MKNAETIYLNNCLVLNYCERNSKMNEISKEALDILQEILINQKISDYWKNRFNNLSDREDIILRGCFKELADEKYISVSWADNYPYMINILKKGYLYDESNKETKKNLLSEKGKDIPEYDVFLSHANADKDSLVNELYISLERLGIKIFYDKKTITWGDNWKNKILNGTKEAEFAIIVISKNFFGREWTEKELIKFLNRQNENGQKLILPIIHGITMDELSGRYPFIAEIQAIDSSNHTCDQIALDFARVLIQRLKSNE